MINNENVKNEILQNLVKQEYKKIFEMLSEHLEKDSQDLRSALLLQGRLVASQTNLRKGLINQSQHEMVQNQVNSGLVEIVAGGGYELPAMEIPSFHVEEKDLRIKDVLLVMKALTDDNNKIDYFSLLIELTNLIKKQ